MGNVAGEIGLAVLTSKGIDKVAKTLKSSKFLKGTAKGWFGKRGRGKQIVSPKTPIGRRGDPIRTLGNTPTKINGRTYTGHALDRMQRDGVMPSVVENVIRNGTKTPGNTSAEIAHIYENLKVITNTAGDVVTVMPQ